MFGHAISLGRLRFYEAECRRARAEVADALTAHELFSFERLFGRAAEENAALNGELAEHGLEPSR